MRVICTAGHVDHGKSTLVRALTGMEPDRFAEEQRRGLTIDIGFAWTQLRAGGTAETVAFVDLPGHERFVPNMLAGAGAVDTVLFVVAADEGWMPQSQEHLDILDLLGVRRGVVALTKSDTVDAETVELGIELVREALLGSTLAAVDILPVSAVTGAGQEALVERLLAALAGADAPADRGLPRLWVDRSFSVRGAGTVVTGTLAGGALTSGQEVEIMPARRRTRIRGLQSLGETVAHALPGDRVAVNLTGVDRDEIARGDAIALAGTSPATTAVEVWVRALPGQEIGRKGAWHLHVGSAEHPVRVRPVETHPVGGSPEGGYVRLELPVPAPLVAGDRFVLREAGRRATVGGGVVLDADPPPAARGRMARTRRAEQLRQRLAAVEAVDAGSGGDRDRLLALHIAERGIAPIDTAAAAVGLDATAAETAAASQGLLAVGSARAHPTAVEEWSTALRAALSAHHAAHPVERAAPKDLAVRTLVAAGCPRARAADLLDALVELGHVAAEGTGLRTPQHAVVLDPAQSAARRNLLERLGEQPFNPPGLGDAATAAGASSALVRELEAAGSIVRVAPDIAFTAEAVEDAVALLKSGFASEGPLTAARAKDLLGTSRKYALPLLEALDRSGRTRRVGDTRVIVG